MGSKLVDQGFQQVSQAAEVSQAHPDTSPEVLSLQVVAPKNGYVQTYLSNESQADINVYFDDLQVVHRGSNILSVTDYYPFGAPFQQPSVGLNGKYLYQGKEWQSSLGLNLYDHHARQYDPYLGRWHVQDPQQQFASPYLAMGNNPISLVDPDGEFVPLIIGVGIGLVSGYMSGRASGATGGELAFQTLAGGLIGGFSGGLGSSVAAGVGASVSGAFGGLLGAAAGGTAAGASSGVFMSGLTGGDPLEGLWKGGVSGLVGGSVGSYISGGVGGLAGGFAGGGTSAALYGGDAGDILTSGLIGGAIAYGSYQASMFEAYQRSDKSFNYRQFRKLSYAAQKSFARGREHGGWITEDDVILNPKMGEKATIPPDRWAPRPGKVATQFHTHPNRGGDYSPNFSNFGEKSDIQSMKIMYLTDQQLGQQTNFMVVSRQNSYRLSGFGAFNNIPASQRNYGFYRYPFFQSY